MPRSAPAKQQSPKSHDEQIRAHTPPDVNRRIDRGAKVRIGYYSKRDKDEITAQIDRLDKERDLDSFLEANAATLSLLGVVLSIAVGRRWLLLPVLTGALLFNHAVRGSGPPANAFRRMGVRTRQEIDNEKYALKAVRGDFDDIRKTSRK